MITHMSFTESEFVSEKGFFFFRLHLVASAPDETHIARFHHPDLENRFFFKANSEVLVTGKVRVRRSRRIGAGTWLFVG